MAYEIDILGEIGDWGYPSNYLRYQLQDAGAQDITINISSPGGNVTEGLAMYDMLEAYEGNVTTLGFGLVASIASVVLLAGKRVEMTPNSFFMIHNPWTLAMGDSEELRANSDLLAKMEKKLQDIYVSRLQRVGKAEGNVQLKVKRMMDAETWLTAQEALDMGFIDEIREVKKEANIIQMQPTLARYVNTPAALLINNTDIMTAKEVLNKVRAMLSGEDETEANATTNQATDTATPEETTPIAEAETAPAMTANEAIAFLESAGYKVMTAEEIAAQTAQQQDAEEMNKQLAETMAKLADEMKTVKAQLKQAIAAPSGGSGGGGTGTKENDKPQASKFDALAAIWNQKMAR